MSLFEAAQKGLAEGLMAQLEAIADRLEDEPSDRDFTALSRHFTDVLEKLSALEKPDRKGTTLDELARRRADREAAAKGSRKAARES